MSATEPEGDRPAEAPAEPERAPADEDRDPEQEWVRRRRLDAVFGESGHGQALDDGWYRDQVPPHHG